MLDVELHVFYHSISAAVNEFYNIILSVAEVVVIGAVIVYGYYSTISIIAEALYGGLCAAGANGHAHEQAAVVVIIGNGVSNGLSDMNFIITCLAIYSILIFFG